MSKNEADVARKIFANNLLNKLSNVSFRLDITIGKSTLNESIDNRSERIHWPLFTAAAHTQL